MMGYYINEFAKSGNSQAFRYPVNTKEKPFLVDDNIIRLNVSALSDIVEWLSYQLEGISKGIDEHWYIEVNI